MKFVCRHDYVRKLSIIVTTLILLNLVPRHTYAVEAEQNNMAPIKSDSLSQPLNSDAFIDGVIAIAETDELVSLPGIVMRLLNVVLRRETWSEPIKDEELYLTTERGYSPEVSLLYERDMIHINIRLHPPIRFLTVSKVGCLKGLYLNGKLKNAGWKGHSMPINGDIVSYAKEGRREFIQVAPHGGRDADKTCTGNIAIRFPRFIK